MSGPVGFAAGVTNTYHVSLITLFYLGAGNDTTDVAGHLHRGLDAAVVAGDVRAFLVAQHAVESAGREIVDAQLQGDGSDPRDEGRFLEPRDHVPADAAALVRGL